MKDKISELKNKIASISEKKNIPQMQMEISELENQTMQPDFWADSDSASKIMQSLGGMKQEIQLLKTYTDRVDFVSEISELVTEDSSEYLDIVKELSLLEKDVAKLELTVYLSGKYDARNALLSIYAGQGGTEANDWAGMVMRMYEMYFEKAGWKYEIVDVITGKEVGIDSVTFEVTGRYAYGYLKNEMGTHRLVRISPFNAQGLRQTSFAGVEVMPVIDNNI